MLDLLLWLLAYQLLGEALARHFGWPLPGPVLGMLLLFATLWLRRAVPATLQREAPRFLGHMSLLFIPAGGALLAYAPLLRSHGWQLLLILLASTLLTALVSAGMLKLLLRGRRR
ncbi:CidA/LrgA family protein [Chromobacterium subtsugae]|uniref:CidA/LrgA family protein n=1 Tax=Chromobacterium subtsugae TaxID=251747 RepID=A0ABS7FDP8_9NEIS|nr:MULTISPECIES: CidA/LrgA family protein [Chromobacterium]KUM02412.1 murein hydrolase transporter LrgA [Chromobacterium subtsugae]KZE86855.1 murein hydrolase transporter LrgA [Chromobacterium sp. F49]MBW7566893.1 CidA/LrgA family protein [Chromobacterium subtsugae]MBW8288197.1 CidA/LrgA family protein [Chromobacterium subtsugae]OBU86603.1 murein hydrolase transporter LrgA [Chromobacterium subtsugae]